MSHSSPNTPIEGNRRRESPVADLVSVTRVKDSIGIAFKINPSNKKTLKKMSIHMNTVTKSRPPLHPSTRVTISKSEEESILEIVQDILDENGNTNMKKHKTTINVEALKENDKIKEVLEVLEITPKEFDKIINDTEPILTGKNKTVQALDKDKLYLVLVNVDRVSKKKKKSLDKGGSKQKLHLIKHSRIRHSRIRHSRIRHSRRTSKKIYK